MVAFKAQGDLHRAALKYGVMRDAGGFLLLCVSFVVICPVFINSGP
jgi:hypothetical protein